MIIHIHVGTLRGPKRAPGSPGARVAGVCEPPEVGAGKLVGPLEEQ